MGVVLLALVAVVVLGLLIWLAAALTAGGKAAQTTKDEIDPDAEGHRAREAAAHPYDVRNPADPHQSRHGENTSSN